MTDAGLIAAYVREHHPEIWISVSATTRRPRPGEVHGEHYFFVDDAEFDRMVADGEMLEWAVVHEELYGTSQAEYERAHHEGLDLLLDVDVQGAAQVRTKMKDAVSIFILPPSFEALERRLRGRGSESESVIARRSVWKYWDRGGTLDIQWPHSFFDDSEWAEGPGALGYGESYLGTTVGYGGDAAHKHITTYFRRDVVVADPETISRVVGEVMYDDGIVVYSVGLDEIDDGGMLDPDKLHLPGCDIGIRLWGPAARGAAPEPEKEP